MALLKQTESLRTTDHPRFLRLLEELHRQTASMTAHERWHLRYLEAWQASFHGDYAHSIPMLRNVADHSGDPVLVTKASAVLVGDLENNKRYGEAFELANHLMANLPQIHDKLARFMALSYVAQLVRSAGQYDLAARYARGMMQTLPQGETACPPMAVLLSVLYADHKLTSSSTELQRGIDVCQAAGQSVFTNTIWLVKGSLYLDEHQPAKALALLQRVAPSIQANQYYSQMLASQVEQAQAYWQLGQDGKARMTALAALAVSDPDDNSGNVCDAYQLLYLIEKKQGNEGAALNYYEHYVAKNRGYLDDISARTLAYEMAQQSMLAQKLQTERLSKQNSVLRLQRALDTKAVEAGRLYIALLLLTLVSIVFWLFRLKRSQLRFKKLSLHDGLTGILNHQHFIAAADDRLRQLEKKRGSACLIFIDLDHFKQVNDTHGHAMGDLVLKHVVDICQSHLRPTDVFGRLGGEEFGILLPDCSRDEGMSIADRIRIAIETNPAEHGERVVSVSTSAGLAATDTSGYELQKLCVEADAALYRAKHSGRNRVVAGGGSSIEV